MKDYSQQGEQKIILDYFSTPAWPYLIGSFVSCGENDGETFSNVRALALRGWSGICVEPSQTAFAKLSNLYATNPHVTLVNAAITETDGPIDFYDSGTHLKKGDTSLLSTTRPEEMNRWKKSGEVFTKTAVQGMTFASLLRSTGASHADFISIDCEGTDWAILQQMNLTELGCRMLCVEGNQSPHRQDFIDYAGMHGMRLHWKNWENLVFTRV
jgi:FkbM family methyltransferase